MSATAKMAAKSKRHWPNYADTGGGKNSEHDQFNERQPITDGRSTK
jgi:hypothetical protein